MKKRLERSFLAMGMIAALSIAPLLAAEPEPQAEPTAAPIEARVTGKTGEAPSEAATAAPESVEDEAAAADTSAPEEKPEIQGEPVTGAFGIPLGAKFEPCMVAKVLGEEAKIYRRRDKSEHQGTLYQVEPREPNPHFNTYSVLTTGDGRVYSIRAEHEPAEKASKCDLTKKLAAVLEEKYGRPRGRGMIGEWYAFRDMSAEVYRGIRLYAPKCRHGRYSIHYGDDAVKEAPETEEETPGDATPESPDAAGL